MGKPTFFLRDRTGRVTHQKGGRGLLAPVAQTVYDPGGLVIETKVYAANDATITTPVGTVQSTKTYYDRLGQVDSIIHPGNRSVGATPRARKQSYIRDRYGNPTWEFPGNGSYIARAYDWQGRLKILNLSQVDPTYSVDGEAFADGPTTSFYNGLHLAMGHNLSAGQVYRYDYDTKGRLIHTVGRDLYLRSDSLTSQTMEYSRTGALIKETQVFLDGAKVTRRYEYNRRGQRVVVADTVTNLSGGSLGDGSYGWTGYWYGTITGRLDSLQAKTNTPSSMTEIAGVYWLYDKAGRDTLESIRLENNGTKFITTRTYDTKGRLSQILTKRSSKTWYQFGTPSYSLIDEVLSHVVDEGNATGTTTYSMAYAYATDGTRRLLSSTKTGSPTTAGHTYTYDVFGNRLTELFTSNNPAVPCQYPATITYGADNRLVHREYQPVCARNSHYWTDHAGNRIAQSDTIEVSPIYQVQRLSYTAANQLYFTLNATHAIGTYDVNWHWYDAGGRRVITHSNTSFTWNATFDPSTGNRTYYVYDGNDIALTILNIGGTWGVRQRFVSGGLDRPLAGRFRELSGARTNLALIGNRVGTIIAGVKSNGQLEPNATYYSKDPFGGLESTSGAAGSQNTETGFTGASTPNQTGGFVYLRNRWYDPQSGRFLTQDPIGLAGGVNLYAYAGNNPITFADPFGLEPCDPPSKPGCRRVNWVKFAVGTVNVVRGVNTAASGATLLVGGSAASTVVGPVAVPTEAVGLVKLAFGLAGVNRGAQQQAEASSGKSRPSARNLLGLLPFGQKFDDPGEPTPFEYAADLITDMISDPVETALRTVKDFFAVEQR